MTVRIIVGVVACLLAVHGSVWGGPVPRETVARIVGEETLENPDSGHLQFAFASLWLDERTDEGNERLREWFGTAHRTDEPLEKLLEQPEEYPDEMVRALGGVKWSARTWLRIYFLFSDESEFFPERLKPDIQEKLEKLAWAFAFRYSTLERADLKYIWAITESENHDMMDFSNAFLALQVVKNLPDYRDREMRDGHSPREHFDAWVQYYRRYCRERAAHGLFVEIASPIYGKHFLGELFNMHDFAADDDLRKKMGMLLDVTWADWAIDQLGGVRGGGKTRAYFGHYAERGTSDSWYSMGNFLFERPSEGQLNWAARHGQVEFVIATSGYRLPEVVAAIALEEEARGEFEYVSRRPARMLRADEVRDRPPLRESGTWYHMDPEDSRLVRYSYVTPDYVLGSIWVDPSLGTVFRLDPENAFPEEENYAAISSQSQWQGVIFSTDPNARIFPQCVGEVSRNRVNFSQHVAVQNKNVMLVRKHRNARSAGDMRVFFSDGMKERLTERDGWLFLREGDAFVGVGVLASGAHPSKETYRWEGDRWIYLQDEYTPVAFVTGRAPEFENLEDFIRYVRNHEYALDGDRLNYSFPDASSSDRVVLTLHLEDERLPEVNGESVNLSPENVYDSPFLFARHGSDRIVIRKGERELVHDFGLRDNAEAAAETEEEVVLYDSGGFLDTGKYPAGDLREGESGEAQWTPAGGTARPGEIVAPDNAPFARVLRRHQTAAERTDADLLDFPAVSDTRLIITFDARVSTADSRTLDLFLMEPGETGPDHQASILIWGDEPGTLSYFDGGYRSLAPIDDQWHSYKLVHDLKANTFDVWLDGERVGEGLSWRNSFPDGTAFGRLRIGSIRGESGDYADLTNLRITTVPGPPTLSVQKPSHPGGLLDSDEPFSFLVSSDVPVSASSIRVRINGEDVTGQLEMEGSDRARHVRLDGFERHRTYRAEISASNERGTTERRKNFYTFEDRIDGYRGIWFRLGQMGGEYGDKYSGGLAFCFSHTLTPMAMYAPEVDKSFFVYGGTTGPDDNYLMIMASYYDHEKHRVPQPTIVRDQRGVDDPHDNPSLTIDGEGHVWVFIAGRGRGRPGQIFRATEPYSVDQFEEIISREQTYSQVWYVPGKGFMHLLTLYTSGRELYWETSESGRDWTENPAEDLEKLAGFRGHYQVSRVDEDRGVVGTAFNYHPGGSVDRRTNIYYLQTDDFGETWRTIEGNVVELPLNDRDNAALAIDYQADDRLAYITKLLFDDQGYPVVLTVTSSGHAPGPANAPRIWEVVRWNGEEWITREVVRSDHNYDMGSLYLDGERWTVIGPAIQGPQAYHTGGEVGLWVSTDGGDTWEMERQVTRQSPLNHSYLRRPHNPQDPFFGVWADGDGADFSISRLYFTNSTGDQVFMLPYQMDGPYAQPILLKGSVPPDP